MKTVLFKLFYLFVMLFIIALISFIFVHLAPNSFFASGELNPNITEERIAHLKIIYSLDKPFYIQFISWITNVLHLDFGISFSSGNLVKEEILSRLPITLTINITSMCFIFIISLYIGIASSINNGGKLDRFIQQISIISFALPSFYLALILTFLFSITFPIFPISGISSDDTLHGIQRYKDIAWHLVLPITILIFGGIGSLTLYIRSMTLEILKSDYVYFAKTRGLSQYKILRFYILPNLYPTVITILGLSIPGIFGGSVILETIFGINGMGLLFFQSAMSNDYPVIMGILIIGAFLTLLGNIIADLILLKLNPNTIK